jgi:hypothetical protein
VSGPGATRSAARAYGDAVSDLIFSPGGELGELLRVHLSDGRVLRFGAADLATGAAIADGILRPAIARMARRDLRAGLAEPRGLTLDEIRRATVEYFSRRAATITRHNVKSVLGDRIPEDQTVVKVDRTLPADAAEGRLP